MKTVRWNVSVSANTDKSLRMFLASQGDGKKGDLSRFIEEAVCTRTLELTAARAKANNIDVSEEEMASAIDEALQWSRRQ